MGSPDAVRQVNNFIMEKIREKPESGPATPTKPDDAKNNFERHRQVMEVFQAAFSPSSYYKKVIYLILLAMYFLWSSFIIGVDDVFFM